MNIRRLFVIAAALFLGTFAPLRADDAAIQRFKADMLKLEKESDELMKNAKPQQDPASGIRMIRALVGKLRATDTTGLPGDLKGAYDEFVVIMGKMEKLFQGWPDDSAGFVEFAQKKAKEDPAFLQNFGPTVEALDKQMKPVIAKLDDLGKKYGIDGFGALAPK